MNTILIIIRTLINDLEETQFTDDLLIKLASVAAINVSGEIHFDTSYSVNLLTNTISPDPDNNFSMFVAYKAAILLLQAEFRKYAFKNIKITDGPSSIDFGNIVSGIKDSLASFTSQYEQMKKNYTINGNVGYVILTPTTVPYLIPNEYE